jgi:uncharacterized protein with PIN domain
MGLEGQREKTQEFLVDCMLGRLARWLRILGCDTWYFRTVEDSDLLELHWLSGRTLLTRDTRLIREVRPGKGLLVMGNRWEEQLRDVTERLRITVTEERILTRCPVCNHPLRGAWPEEVQSRVPEHVFQTHGMFRVCKLCGRVYWGGTHRRAIFRVIERVVGPRVEPGEGRGPTAEAEDR